MNHEWWWMRLTDNAREWMRMNDNEWQWYIQHKTISLILLYVTYELITSSGRLRPGHCGVSDSGAKRSRGKLLPLGTQGPEPGQIWPLARWCTSASVCLAPRGACLWECRNCFSGWCGSAILSWLKGSNLKLQEAQGPGNLSQLLPRINSENSGPQAAAWLLEYAAWLLE